MADDDLELDDDDMPSGQSGVPAPTDFDDDDFDLEDEFDYDEGGGKSKFKALFQEKKKLILIGVGALVALGAIGGGAYWYFMSDDAAQMAEEKPAGGVGAAVGMALQQQASSGLTPPPSKLSVGGATGGAKLSAGGGTPSPSKLTAGGVTAGASMATSSANMGGYNPDNAQTPLSTAAVADVGVMIPAVLPTAVVDLGTAKAPQGTGQKVEGTLLEQTEEGLLPIISKEGQESWRLYARPFGGDANQPTIGLVITGLGLSESLTQAAIDHAPGEVTLAFSPYGRGVKQWVEKARAMGHEVLLELPMEADSFPVDDPGPLAMMTTKKPDENLKLLSLIMGQAQGYTGFIAKFGSRFLRDNKAMSPVLGELKARGLFFMDPATADGSVSLELADKMQLPRAIANSTIQTQVSEQRVRAQLETLATLARNQGLTVAVMPATPNGLKTLKGWAASLNGVQLAPMSALAGRQPS